MKNTEYKRFVLLLEGIHYYHFFKKRKKTKHLFQLGESHLVLDINQQPSFSKELHIHTNSTHTQACSHVLNICPLTNQGKVMMDVWKSHAGQQMPIKILCTFFSTPSPLVMTFICTHLRQAALQWSAILSWHDITATVH